MGKRISAVALLLLAGLWSWYYLDKRNLERLHELNLQKAAEFERQFDGQFPPGSPLGVVQAYFESTGKKWVQGFDVAHKVSEIRFEFVTGESPPWYCGEESVGIIAHFKNDALVSTEVSAWSYNCL